MLKRSGNQQAAAELTLEFKAWLRRQWGKPSRARIMCAAFEVRYPNGGILEGWHGHPKRGYGDLYCVLSVLKQSRLGIDRLAYWNYAFTSDDLWPMSDQALRDYQEFIRLAKESIRANKALVDAGLGTAKEVRQ